MSIRSWEVRMLETSMLCIFFEKELHPYIYHRIAKKLRSDKLSKEEKMKILRRIKRIDTVRNIILDLLRIITYLFLLIAVGIVVIAVIGAFIL